MTKPKLEGLNKVPCELLKACVLLDTDTGKLVWKVRPVWTFSGKKYPLEREASRWNTNYSGAPAFSTLSKAGYLTGRLAGVSLYAHRVVWALSYGTFPEFWLDHIDGDRTNNKVENLRQVLYEDNNKNSSLRKDNKTGVTGVTKKGNKFVANIKDLTGVQKHLGTFNTLEEASLARTCAEGVYHYHPNHGKTK